MPSPIEFARKTARNALDLVVGLLTARVRLRLGYAYLGGGVGLTRTHRGHKILVYTRDFTITPHIILDGVWERWVEHAVLSLLKPGSIVVEIGSNMGYHTLHMCQAIGAEGRLHAFEANPVLFPLLQASVEMNGYASRTSLYNHAVLDAPREVAFQYTPAHVGSANIVANQPETDSTVIRVRGVCLDEMLAHVPRVDMLRMDAEGSEPLIAKGARKLIERSPEIAIISEWSIPMMAPRGRAEDFLALLDASGFRSWVITQRATFAPITFPELLSAPLCEVVFSRQEPPRVERQ